MPVVLLHFFGWLAQAEPPSQVGWHQQPAHGKQPVVGQEPGIGGPGGHGIGGPGGGGGWGAGPAAQSCCTSLRVQPAAPRSAWCLAAQASHASLGCPVRLIHPSITSCAEQLPAGAGAGARPLQKPSTAGVVHPAARRTFWWASAQASQAYLLPGLQLALLRAATQRAVGACCASAPAGKSSTPTVHASRAVVQSIKPKLGTVASVVRRGSTGPSLEVSGAVAAGAQEYHRYYSRAAAIALPTRG